MNKVKTTKIQGDVDYATVPARLKEFQEQYKRSDIQVESQLMPDESYIVTTTIKSDLSDETSKAAQGTARYTAKEMQGVKKYEKLCTISLGRALSNLGFLNDGQIAGSEEMDEFNEWRDERDDLAIDTINAANTMDELKEAFLSLGNVTTMRVIKAKDARKAELQNEDSKAGTK